MPIPAGGATEIVTFDEVKDHLNIPASDTSSDAELQRFIDAATEWVESRVGPVVQRTVTETVRGGSDLLELNQSPVISLTSVAGTRGWTGTYTLTDLYLDEDAGLVRRAYDRAFTDRWLTVTYTAGRDSVPPAVKWATLEMVKWLWETQRGGARMPMETDGGDFIPGFGTVPHRIPQMLEPHLLPPSVA